MLHPVCYTPCILISILFVFSFPYHYVSIRLLITNDFVESGPKTRGNVKKLRLQYRNLQISVFLMLHPICFLPTLYTDTDMSIFGMHGYCVSFPNMYTFNGFYPLVFERHATI